jgi:hypothetical protein
MLLVTMLFLLSINSAYVNDIVTRLSVTTAEGSIGDWICWNTHTHNS